ncbi:MAG: thioredoxin-dependent thiol peroxidase [Alphaproteobacteria bacterium]
MSDPMLNKPLPELTLETDGGRQINLSDWKGSKTVLYFYPKDNTSGCTAQACDFRDNMERITAAGYQVFGVSRDSVKKHDNFKDKYELNFPLISDPEEKLCDAFGVMKEKSMYGKKYMGIERSTFIINEEGKVTAAWRKVKVPGHVDEVLEALTA